jgi:hypothetical protein
VAGRVRAAPGALPPTPGACSAYEGPATRTGAVLRRAAPGGAAGQDGVDLADGLGVHTQNAASGRAGVVGGDAGAYLGVGQVGPIFPHFTL